MGGGGGSKTKVVNEVLYYFPTKDYIKGHEHARVGAERTYNIDSVSLLPERDYAHFDTAR